VQKFQDHSFRVSHCRLGFAAASRIACAVSEASAASVTSYGRHLKGGSRDSVGDMQMLVRWRLVS
jgi:hypothetical protein